MGFNLAFKGLKMKKQKNKTKKKTKQKKKAMSLCSVGKSGR